MTNTMIDNAIMFATLAHSNQKRKGKDMPYIMHPIEAGVIASQIKYSEEIICAAILHDTMEDSYVTIETLEEMFNERIAILVKAQSEDKSKTWKERKKHTIDYLKLEQDQEIKIVALSDKLSNIRSLYRDYCNEEVGEKLWGRFNVKDKEEHKWYYHSLIDSLKSLDKYKEYNEYKELVIKLFGNKNKY